MNYKLFKIKYTLPTIAIGISYLAIKKSKPKRNKKSQKIHYHDNNDFANILQYIDKKKNEPIIIPQLREDLKNFEIQVRETRSTPFNL